MTNRTEAETKLLKEIQTAVKKFEKDDSRDGGSYFEHEGVVAFQKIARKLAKIIEDQGVKKTDAGLVEAARKIGSFEGSFTHANTLGFAFKKALKAAVQDGAVKDKKANPFSGMKL